MICIAVALARVLPVVSPSGRLTEYGSARGETVNRDKHLGRGPARRLALGAALPGRFRCRHGGLPRHARGDL
jgi:hypothetical protein